MIQKNRFNIAVVSVAFCLVVFFVIGSLMNDFLTGGESIEETQDNLRFPTQNEQGRSDNRNPNFRSPLEMSIALSRNFVIHGRVIDETGTAVPGAKVTYSVINGMYLGNPNSKIVMSDGSGNFEFDGGYGTNLSVSAAHENYYSSDESGVMLASTEYIAETGDMVYNKGMGLVLRLTRKGASVPLVRGRDREYIKSGDIYYYDIESGGLGSERDGGRLISFVFEGDPSSGSTYPWTLMIEVEGGEISPRNGRLEFTAPNEGWKERVLMGFESKSSRWSWAQEREFFIRFDDDTYGRIDVECVARSARLGVTSWYDPAGGKRLEPIE